MQTKLDREVHLLRRLFIGFPVDDRPELDIHDRVMERDSLTKLTDSVARAARLQRWRAPRMEFLDADGRVLRDVR
jgi:hypothetical protein